MTLEVWIAAGLAVVAIVVMGAIALIDRRILSGMRRKEDENDE